MSWHCLLPVETAVGPDDPNMDNLVPPSDQESDTNVSPKAVMASRFMMLCLLTNSWLLSEICQLAELVQKQRFTNSYNRKVCRL